MVKLHRLSSRKTTEHTLNKICEEEETFDTPLKTDVLAKKENKTLKSKSKSTHKIHASKQYKNNNNNNNKNEYNKIDVIDHVEELLYSGKYFYCVIFISFT